MDFITNLPLVGGYDTVLVIVDQCSKMAHFVPFSKTISGEETADLFLKNVENGSLCPMLLLCNLFQTMLD